MRRSLTGAGILNMSKVGEAAYEAVLTRGDVTPRAMESLVDVLIFGKAEESSTTDSSTTTSSTTSTTSSTAEDPKSKQLVGSPFDALARGEFVPPRYNPEVWASAMEQSTRLGRAIRTYARNTVGLGWYIEPLHKPTPETPEEHKLRIRKQTARLQKVFESPNSLMPTSQMFYMSKVDEEATGNGYIEIVRDNAGSIAKIFHVPAVTMRIRVRKEEGGEQKIGGFVQIRGNEKRYFKEFGDQGVMDATTGEYFRGSKPLSLDKRATEILHFKLYSPTSTWYGAPRYVSASPAISGNRLAALRNVKFFENDAVPRMALLVSGGRLTPDSINAVEDFFKAKVQGPEKAHSVVVIQTEQTKVGFQQNAENARIDLKPLTVGVTEDASFGQYRQANDDEIRECFGIAPVFFSTENVNKACLVGETRIPLLDGRSLSFSELVAEYGGGGNFWIYSVDARGEVVPGQAHSPRMTKTAEIWEVLLDNGEIVRGTDDHLFMLLDGSYKQLSSLSPGERLKPLYRSIRPIARAESPYWWYSTNGMKKMDAVHRMVGKFLNCGKVTKGIDVHHRGNSLDNRPESLELLSKSGHMSVSGSLRWADADDDKKRQVIELGLKNRKLHESLVDIENGARNCYTWRQLAIKFGVHQDTVINRIRELGHNPVDFRERTFKERPARVYRSDVTLDSILQEAPKHKSIHSVAKGLKSSTSRVLRVLRDSGKTWGWVKSEFLGVCVGSGENHRVIAVRRTGEVFPVYDLTVDVHHNFALHCGVFVHNSAQVSREITNEQEFEPDRLEKEYIINQTIVPEILREEPFVRFRFERMKLTDPLDTARMDQTYASLGALTPNELRESMGKPPFPKEYKFADKPMQVAMAELSMQLAEAIIGEFKSQIGHQKEQARAQQEASGMSGMLGMGGLGAPPGGAVAPTPTAEGQGQGQEAAPTASADSPEAGGSEEVVPAEWDNTGTATTEESSPISEVTTEDSHVGRIKEALGFEKSDIPVATILSIATELMQEARQYKSVPISSRKEED
jgi:capsid portal protein